jgi:hypothetical protein
MEIAIIGTGTVGQALADRWAAAGHELVFGSRRPEATTLAHRVAPLADAAASAEVIVNATPGAASLEVLNALPAEAIAGKVLIDVANALTPGLELRYPNSSLGERLQAALPGARVVKTMNTAQISVIVDPSLVGPSNLFVSGDDPAAKETVRGLVGDFGWPEDAIIDLGGITTARGTEHLFLLSVSLMQARSGKPMNLRVVD